MAAKKSLKAKRAGKHCKHGFRKGSAKCRKTARRSKR
jgi:hypothetical protein